MSSWTIATSILVIFSGALVSEGSVVKNVSVNVVALKNEREALGAETRIRISLNVSWLPPENDSEFFSYSVIVTRVQLNLTNSTDDVHQNHNRAAKVSSLCPEGSIYYVGQDINQTHVLLPEDRLGSGSSSRSTSELNIEPACSYAVEIFANHRYDDGAAASSASMVFTVPKCVGTLCNCYGTFEILPVPIVSVINPYKGGTLINWKIQWKKLAGDNQRIDIRSYQISVGLPHVISSNDMMIYNKTLIFVGNANNSSFFWNQEKLTKGTKFFVTAQDSYGCSGKEGTDAVKKLRHRSFYRKNVAAIIFAALVALCLMISGLLNFIKYFIQNNKHKLFSRWQKSTRKFTSILPQPNIDLVLNNEKMLYSDNKIKISS